MALRASNNGYTYTNRVPPEIAGQTVLAFYTQHYPHSSQETWETHIRSGLVQVNGKTVTPDTQLAVDDRLAYHRAPWQEPGAPCSFAVLYEDDHLLAVAKPSGLPVLPGGNYLDNTLLACVRKRCPDPPEPAPIHRLGRGTSGIVLFARTLVAKQRLSQDFHDRRIRKTYRTLVVGADMPDRVTVNTPIGRIPYPQINYLYAATPDGKPSQTECRMLHRDPDNNRSLVHVDLITGRPHQIRIHLAAAGHPLVGDPLYRAGGLPVHTADNNRLPLPGDTGYHLHACRICFAHPITGHALDFTCKPPPMLCIPEEKP